MKGDQISVKGQVRRVEPRVEGGVASAGQLLFGVHQFGDGAVVSGLPKIQAVVSGGCVAAGHARHDHAAARDHRCAERSHVAARRGVWVQAVRNQAEGGSVRIRRIDAHRQEAPLTAKRDGRPVEATPADLLSGRIEKGEPAAAGIRRGVVRHLDDGPAGCRHGVKAFQELAVDRGAAEEDDRTVAHRRCRVQKMEFGEGGGPAGLNRVQVGQLVKSPVLGVERPDGLQAAIVLAPVIAEHHPLPVESRCRDGGDGERPRTVRPRRRKVQNFGEGIRWLCGRGWRQGQKNRGGGEPNGKRS